MTSISSEAFDKTKTESQRMKDNTLNKKIISGKTDKVSYWADVIYKTINIGDQGKNPKLCVSSYFHIYDWWYILGKVRLGKG